MWGSGMQCRMMKARRGAMVERLVWVLVGVLPLLLLMLLLEQGAEAGRPLVVLKCEVIEAADEAQQELPLCEVGVDCSRWPLTTITSIATPYPYRGLAEIAPPAPSGGAAMPDPLPTLDTRPSPPPPLQPELPPADPLCFRNLDCFDVAPPTGLAPSDIELPHANPAQTESSAADFLQN